MTSGCCWTYSSIAARVYLKKRTIVWEGLLARFWTVKCTFELMIADLLTVTLILDRYQLPSTLLILDSSPFQIYPVLLFHGILSKGRAFRPCLPLYLILRTYVESQVPPPRGRLIPISQVFRFRRRSLPHSRELLIIDSIVYLNLVVEIDTGSSMYSWKQVTSFEVLPYTKKLYGRKSNRTTGLFSWLQGIVRQLWCRWKWWWWSSSTFPNWWCQGSVWDVHC